MSKRFIVLLLSFLLVLSPVVAHAETEYEGNLENTVRSIQKDYFMGVFHKTVQDGSDIFDFSGELEKNRKDLNYRILTGAEEKNYSLYDRFGGNVRFPMYLGEKVVKTGAADKIYTALEQAAEDNLDFKSALDLIKKDATSYANKYYQNRPPLKNSGNDPRVERYDSVGGTTVAQDVELASANWFLNISKIITSLTCLLVSDQLPKAAFDIVKNFIEGNSWSAISDILKALTPVFVIFVVIYIVRKTYPVVSGKYSTAMFFQNLLGTALSLGMLVFLLANPSAFIDVSKNIVTIGDKIGSIALNEAYKDNEIVHSDSLDNVTRAAIWEDSVFKPWVKGTFAGNDYDKLYTNNSKKDESKIWDLSEQSSRAIGDISVPTGSDEVKNWAALAYSCQSIYHINSVDNKYKTKNDPEEDKKYWPKASMAASNRYIYDDDFRWLDASLKVGNYDSNTGSPSVAVYEDTVGYRFDGTKYGFEALFMAILLLPLLVIGWKKTMSIFNLLLAFSMFISRSILNMINPDSGEFNIFGTLKLVGSNIVSYFWFCIMALIGISLYKTIATSTFIMQLFYIVIMIYLCRLKPQNYKSYAASTFDTIKSYGTSIAGYGSERFKTFVNNTRSFKEDSIVKAKMDKDKLKEEQDNNRKLDEDDYQYSDQGDKERFGTVDNQLICKIKKEDYDDAWRKTKNSYYKERYRALSIALDDCRTNRDIAIVINKHRSMKGNTDMDFKVLNIPKDNLAHLSYYNDRTNTDYNATKAEKSKAIRYKANLRNARISRDKSALTNELNSLKQNYSSLKPEDLNVELKKLEKGMNKLAKDSKFNNLQSQINVLTGNRSGGAFFSLKVKLYILLGIVAAIFLWYIISIIVGVI